MPHAKQYTGRWPSQYTPEDRLKAQARMGDASRLNLDTHTTAVLIDISVWVLLDAIRKNNIERLGLGDVHIIKVGKEWRFNRKDLSKLLTNEG